MNPICEATIDYFGGTSVVRDNFRVVFTMLGYNLFSNCFTDFMKTRFFQTLKELKGFPKSSVVLVLEMAHYCGYNLDKEGRRLSEKYEGSWSPPWVHLFS